MPYIIQHCPPDLNGEAHLTLAKAYLGVISAKLHESSHVKTHCDNSKNTLDTTGGATVNKGVFPLDEKRKLLKKCLNQLILARDAFIVIESLTKLSETMYLQARVLNALGPRYYSQRNLTSKRFRQIETLRLQSKNDEVWHLRTTEFTKQNTNSSEGTRSGSGVVITTKLFEESKNKSPLRWIFNN